MKKFLLAIFMFLCTVSFCHENYSKEEKKIEIVKKGHWGKDNARSGEEIIATYNNSGITMLFNVNLGQIEISIENEYGNIVHSSYFYANKYEASFIPINNLPSGTYVIIINCNDIYAEGEFRIER